MVSGKNKCLGFVRKVRSLTNVVEMVCFTNDYNDHLRIKEEIKTR